MPIASYVILQMLLHVFVRITVSCLRQPELLSLVSLSARITVLVLLPVILTASRFTASQNHGLSSHCQPELLSLCLSASQVYGLLSQCPPELLYLVLVPVRITVSCLSASQNYCLLSHFQSESRSLVSLPARITVFRLIASQNTVSCLIASQYYCLLS